MEKFIGRYCPKCKLMISDPYIKWVGDHPRSVSLHPLCMVCNSQLEARFEETGDGLPTTELHEQVHAEGQGDVQQGCGGVASEPAVGGGEEGGKV